MTTTEAANSNVAASEVSLHSGMQYLRQVAEAAQSFEQLGRLSGQVASEMHVFLADTSNTDKTSQLAIEYLLAVVRHLPAASSGENLSSWSDAEMRASSIKKDVLQVVSACVKKVVPRKSIAETGILSILHGLCDHEMLMPEHCEFLQACIFAQEYQLAESQILHTWPRPHKGSSTTVETVLRYFYLRGVVHLNCGASSFPLAIRCFWTCLSVPATSDANIVSAIAVSAWKKLVLVQALHYTECMSDATVLIGTKESEAGTKNALLQTGSTTSNGNTSFDPLATPKEMSAGLSRFLSSAKAPQAPENQPMNERPSASPITSPMSHSIPEADGPEVMHFVEAEGGEISSENERYSSMGVYVYKELLKAFIATDRISFDALVTEHGSVFRDDGNMGLTRRVASVLLHRQVYELSHVYSVVSISQLSSDLGMSIPDVQSVLEQLRVKGWPVELRPDGVVAFPHSPPSWSQPMDDKEVKDEMTQLSRMIRLINGTLRKPRNKDVSSFQSDLSGPCGVEDF